MHFDFGEESINSGDMATVNCAVTKGDFPMNITWLFNGKPIDRTIGITTGQMNKRISTISIESVNAEHAGEYTCNAYNKAGMSTYSATLNVNGTILRMQYLCCFLLKFFSFHFALSFSFHVSSPSSDLTIRIWRG